MSRIHELTERRRKLRATPWHLWQPDHEARANHLDKLIDLEYAAKRGAENTVPPIPRTGECEDCLLRQQQNQPARMRIRHSDRGKPMPTGRPLDEKCEACGDAERVMARVW